MNGLIIASESLDKITEFMNKHLKIGEVTSNGYNVIIYADWRSYYQTNWYVPYKKLNGYYIAGIYKTYNEFQAVRKLDNFIDSLLNRN
jgi:hypothetical protein